MPHCDNFVHRICREIDSRWKNIGIVQIVEIESRDGVTSEAARAITTRRGRKRIRPRAKIAESIAIGIDFDKPAASRFAFECAKNTRSKYTLALTGCFQCTNGPIENGVERTNNIAGRFTVRE